MSEDLIVGLWSFSRNFAVFVLAMTLIASNVVLPKIKKRFFPDGIKSVAAAGLLHAARQSYIYFCP